MKPEYPNPQKPNPWQPKLRLSEYARLYKLSPAAVSRQIRTNRITAEQPAGPGTSWFIWIDEWPDVDLESEAMFLEEVRSRVSKAA